MPPATITTSRALASVSGQARAERAAHADPSPAARCAERRGHRADGADRVDEPAAAVRIALTEIGASPTPNA